MSTEELAINGGRKAVAELGPFPAKIGKDELLEVLSLWQFSPQTQRKLKELIENEPEVQGPHLFRYYNPKPSKVAAAEAAMRELIGVRHCLAVSSCTSALAASYRALGIGAGDTGICLVMFLPTAGQARTAIEAMQAEGVPAGGIYDLKIRDWHIYNYWEPILNKKSVSPDGLPWSAVPAAELPRYSRDICPRALSLLSRAILLDINWKYSSQDCSAIALGINKALGVILQ